MIPLQEFKNYLNLDGDTIDVERKDIIRQGFINSAIAKMNAEANRTFLRGSYVQYFDCHFDKLFLDCTPIITIDSVKYLDTATNEYTDLFTGTDTIANSVTIFDNYISFVKSTVSRKLKVTYVGGYKFATGTGRITTVDGTLTVAGTDTLFTTEIEVGDYISVEGQRVRVASIESDTALTLEEAAISDLSGKGYNISTVPESLRLICLRLASMMYFESPIGKNLMIKSSDGVPQGGSTNYKEYDLKKELEPYRVLSI